MTERTFIVEGYNETLTSEQIKYIDLIGIEFEGKWEVEPDNIHIDESLNFPRNHDDEEETPVIDADHDCHTCTPHQFTMPDCIVSPEDCRRLLHTHCPPDCADPAHCDTTCDKHCGCAAPGHKEGETISPPLRIEPLRDWVYTHSPDKVNNTCGTHIHLSFVRKSDYVRLMEPRFTDFFVETFIQWAKDMCFPKKHQIWARLKGDNKYCRKEWNANIQAAQTIKNAGGEPGKVIRRKQLNFCYNILVDVLNADGTPVIDPETGTPRQIPRGTLENRLLPAFKDPAYTMSAIETFIRCVEEYLSSTEGQEEEFKSIDILIDGDDNLIKIKE